MHTYLYIDIDNIKYANKETKIMHIEHYDNEPIILGGLTRAIVQFGRHELEISRIR